MELMESPIYNLSMSSLENFHTAFWKWLGNNYKRDFLRVLDEQFSDNAKIDYQDQVPYGKHIIVDLLITINDEDIERNIVIENKLKSFPTDKQLQKYEEKFKKGFDHFILISLAPKFDLPDGWRYISYKELASKMREIFNSTFKYKNDYHKLLIEDYINVIEEISSKLTQEKTNKYDFYEKSDLDKLKLNDIYIKYRSSEIGKYIKENLNKFVKVGVDFHNKKGTISIYKEFGELNYEAVIGIQIEYDQYRYYLDIGDISNDDREKIAQNLYDKNLWFKHFSKETLNCTETNSPKRSRIYNNFCGYDPSFIYRYIDLINIKNNKKELKELSYEEIVKFLKEDVDFLEKNIETIKSIIKDNLDKTQK